MKNNVIKKIILYVLASTGAVLFIFAVYAMINGGKAINGNTILEIMGANTVITIGLILFQKIECRYAILEVMLDIGFMAAVIVICGLLFKWYSDVPMWLHIIIAPVVYIIFYLLDIIRVRKDIDEINELLKKNKEKETNTAS